MVLHNQSPRLQGSGSGHAQEECHSSLKATDRQEQAELSEQATE